MAAPFSLLCVGNMETEKNCELRMVNYEKLAPVHLASHDDASLNLSAHSFASSSFLR